VDDAGPIGYVVALPPECRTLIPRRSCRGDILELDRVHRIAVAGAGSDNATAAAEALIARGVRRLVSWGCAAALADGLRPGALVIPQAVIHADGARTSFATPWQSQLLACLQPVAPVCTGPIAECDGIVASAEAKRNLHRTTGAIAADMETGAVARAAQRCGLPSLTIRSIVDTVSVTIPRSAQAALDGDGEIVVSRLLLQLLRSPSEILPLLDLARAFRCAMQSLARVAAHLGPGLDRH